MNDPDEAAELFELGQALRVHRERMPLTQEELAERLGVSQSSVTAWETSGRIPAARAEALGEVFNVPADTFSRDPLLRFERSIAVIWPHTEEEWVDELRRELEARLWRARFVPVPITSEINFNWEEHRALQRKVARDKRYYGACIDVVSAWELDKLSDCNAFAQDFGKQVIFVDLGLGPVHPQKISPCASFVSFNDSEGGKRAADAVLMLPNRAQRQRIVVIAAPVKNARHKSFMDALRSRVPHCRVEIFAVSGFDSWEAAQLVRKLITKGLADNDPVNAFYFTSDSYALGFDEAAEDVLKSHGAERPSAIGYDGTRRIQRLMARGRMSAAVEQNTGELADRVVDHVRSYFFKRPRTRIDMLRPRLCLRGKDRATKS